MRNWHTTEIIRLPDNAGIFSKLFQSPPTIAELSKEEFVAFRAVSQKQLGCKEYGTR